MEVFMEILNLDLGLKEYQLPGGVLRFNPSDPNVYARFVESADKIRAVEQEQAAKAKILTDKNPENIGEESLKIMKETDRRMKSILNEVFGTGNDFDQLLAGVNLMAVSGNGERVITSLLEALKPIMEAGAKDCVNKEVGAAKLNREQRRAMQ